MELKSKRLGEIEYTDEDTITFPDGIPGFPAEQSFLIIAVEEHSPLHFLQSIHNPDLVFVVVNPFLFFQEYDFEVPDSIMERIGIENPNNVQVWSIVALKDPFETSTVNLQAPIIVNTKGKKAKQAILNVPEYTTRHFLFPQDQEMSQSQEGR